MRRTLSTAPQGSNMERSAKRVCRKEMEKTTNHAQPKLDNELCRLAGELVAIAQSEQDAAIARDQIGTCLDMILTHCYKRETAIAAASTEPEKVQRLPPSDSIAPNLD